MVEMASGVVLRSRERAASSMSSRTYVRDFVFVPLELKFSGNQ